MHASAIAVTAYGAVTALGAGVQALWAGLLEGRRPFAQVRAFDVTGCRARIAAEVSVAVPNLGDDRSAGLGLMAAEEAIRERPIATTPAERIGLVVGSAGAGTLVLENALLDTSALPPAWWRRYEKRWLADVIASALHIEGPRAVVNTACSSSLVAMAVGVDWLRGGDCDLVLVIGTDELGRFTYTGFHALRALDPDPCKPFDRGRRGLSMGEGAGCVMLERAADVRRRGGRAHGYVLSVGLSCDAHHLTAPDPEGEGAARALTNALGAANLDADAIGFINAHGTGTPLNDAAEIASVERVLGARAVACPVHSVKATTGHCMGAAGAIEAVVALRSLETSIVPATAGLVECEFEGRVNCVQGSPIHVAAAYAVSTNFGFGGNDAALVLSHA